VRALGIDVGVRKGLDLVVLEEGVPVPIATQRRVLLTALGGMIERTGPDVVAIDAPPGWATRGRSRQTEREIRSLGIHSFGTPTARRAGRNRTGYYEWMRRGFRAFRLAERRGYSRYRGGSPRRTALEVFPHATAVVLSGCLPPPGVPKRSWRSSVLIGHGIEAGRLVTTDQVDAALAALTGLLALKGTGTALGDPNEGMIVLPTRTLPARPYHRCQSPTDEQASASPTATRGVASGDASAGSVEGRREGPRREHLL
jgi:predicted nuclease with RNAse H fold